MLREASAEERAEAGLGQALVFGVTAGAELVLLARVGSVSSPAGIRSGGKRGALLSRRDGRASYPRHMNIPDILSSGRGFGPVSA